MLIHLQALIPTVGEQGCEAIDELLKLSREDPVETGRHTIDQLLSESTRRHMVLVLAHHLLLRMNLPLECRHLVSPHFLPSNVLLDAPKGLLCLRELFFFLPNALFNPCA